MKTYLAYDGRTSKWELIAKSTYEFLRHRMATMPGIWVCRLRLVEIDG